jgi:hypothetical protein
MPERMSDKTFKLWQERLRFAKNTWMRKGLIGTQQASVMRMLIEFYRGNQWAHLSGIPGLEDEDLACVNKIFPVANTINGDVASRNPKVQVFPRNEDSAGKAIPVENLINYDIEELNFKRQSNKALSGHLFAPFWAVRHGFTPSEETETEGGRRLHLYRPAKPDRPWIRAWPCWNTLMDPRAESFHVDEGLEWVAFREVQFLEDIKDNPNMISRQDLGDYAGNISPEWQETGPRDGFDWRDDPDKDRLVELFTVYEAREQTWFQMTLDSLTKPLRNPDEWPIPWETLPVSIFQVNEQIDTPFPLSIMDECAPIQVEMNRLRTMMYQLVFRLRRLLMYQKNSIDNDEVKKVEDGAINELIACSGVPRDVIQMVTSGVFPQELLQYWGLLEEDLREVVGQSKMGRAQRINVETAHEVERVQQGQDVNTGRIVDAYETFNHDIIRLYMQGRRTTMDITGPEIVRIVGQQDADGLQQWGRVEPGDLHGDFDFHVVHGSTRPRDREREAQQAALDLQIAQGMTDQFKLDFWVRRFCEARGVDPARGMNPNSLVASYVRNLDEIRRQAQIGEEAPAGGGPAGGGLNPAAAIASNAGGLTQ